MKISCPTCRIYLKVHKDRYQGINKDVYWCYNCGLYYNITCMYGQEDWKDEFEEQ